MNSLKYLLIGLLAVSPAATSAAVTNTGGAAITISCSEEVRILPLEARQPIWHDSKGHPKIENISPELSGWQFVCIPWHKLNTYEIRINQDGVLYAFCGANRNRTAQDLLGTEEPSKWEAAAGAISTPESHLCFRRKVSAGEVIKLQGFELQLAAKSIELVRDGKAESAAQPTAPVPTSAVVAPQSNVPPGQAWTNSLGMKFVPVPGTSVQFSIWDTRVQDYQAFVTATGRAWEQPPYEQGPTHPAVMVLWKDAKAFCSWLTKKERRAGTLTSAQEYRLPTDLEWSAAVGLENESGNTPKERSGKIKDVFPWGTQWPAPRGVGNYAASLDVDDSTNTSPVGSFAANRFGLFDMGGNVWQWCEDLYDGQSGARYSRGGSWIDDGRDFLLSSCRDLDGPISRRKGLVGFRCVLAGGGVSALPTHSDTASTAAIPPPALAPSLPPSGGIQPEANQSLAKTLSQQALNAIDWVLAPLDQSVPGDIRRNLTALREDLLDEAKDKPAAVPEAYAMGRQLCDTLMAVLDERDATLARVGYRSAQANANTRVTSQALEARRNYMMSWPQYAREKDQAGEIFRQQMNNANLTKELPKVEWSNRTAVLRKTLDSLYAKYREALRQGKK